MDAYFRGGEGGDFARRISRRRVYLASRNSFSMHPAQTTQVSMSAAVQMTDVSGGGGLLTNITHANGTGKEGGGSIDDVCVCATQDDVVANQHTYTNAEEADYSLGQPYGVSDVESAATPSAHNVDIQPGDVQSVGTAKKAVDLGGRRGNILFPPPTSSMPPGEPNGDVASSVQLQRLYDRMCAPGPWSMVDELPHSVLVLSGSGTPHILLKSSMVFLSIMGLRASQIFGRCLEDFLLGGAHTSPVNKPTALGSNHPPANPSEELASLLNFYSSIERTGMGSCVLNLVTQRGRTVAFSVHAFSIYRRGRNPTEAETTAGAGTSRSELNRSSQILLPFAGMAGGNKTVVGDGSGSGESAFYVLYLNNFNRDMDGSALLDGRDEYLHPQVSVDPPTATGGSSRGGDSLSLLTPPYDGSSVLSYMTEELRDQGLANDL